MQFEICSILVYFQNLQITPNYPNPKSINLSYLMHKDILRLVKPIKTSNDNPKRHLRTKKNLKNFQKNFFLNVRKIFLRVFLNFFFVNSDSPYPNLSISTLKSQKKSTSRWYQWEVLVSKGSGETPTNPNT